MEHSASPLPANLVARTVRVTMGLLVVQGIVLFATAGTFGYWQAWIYLGLQLVSMGATNAYLLKTDPALLERRLASEEAGEPEPVQRRIMALMRLLALGLLVTAGLDRRLGGFAVPPAGFAAGCLVFTLGVALIVRVFRENTFGSSVIDVTAHQTVVSTGPYRFVRHPMYAGAILMGLAGPLVLGSLHAEVFVLLSFALLVARILAEERLLSEKLGGYAEYMKETRWRLIPGVW